jgi:hypothetical protein
MQLAPFNLWRTNPEHILEHVSDASMNLAFKIALRLLPIHDLLPLLMAAASAGRLATRETALRMLPAEARRLLALGVPLTEVAALWPAAVAGVREVSLELPLMEVVGYFACVLGGTAVLTSGPTVECMCCDRPTEANLSSSSMRAVTASLAQDLLATVRIGLLPTATADVRFFAARSFVCLCAHAGAAVSLSEADWRLLLTDTHPEVVRAAADAFVVHVLALPNRAEEGARLVLFSNHLLQTMSQGSSTPSICGCDNFTIQALVRIFGSIAEGSASSEGSMCSQALLNLVLYLDDVDTISALAAAELRSLGAKFGSVRALLQPCVSNYNFAAWHDAKSCYLKMLTW